jgi:hypothetical protein
LCWHSGDQSNAPRPARWCIQLKTTSSF